MILSIVTALIAGILAGYVFVPASFLPHAEFSITIILCVLLFLVGISIGQNKTVFRELKRHGLLLLVIPLSIILGSTVGGVIGAWMLGMPVNQGTAISSGFGWYSLSGILLTRLHGPDLGALAFLTNVVREVLAVLMIPWLARHINHYTAIAPAGATSMDTTLPLIAECTNEEVAVIAFVNGALLSSLVPILVPFCYSL